MRLNRCPPENKKPILSCGRFKLPLGQRPLIMGILNVTPDSFSDGGRYVDVRQAVRRALRMQEEGADLIDIGGESTRPGARLVPVQEELNRVLPVLEKLQGKLRIPISVDTSKPEVARDALREGASLINDVSGLRDSRMAEIVAAAHVPVILMHMRGTPLTMQKKNRYRRLIPEIRSELAGSVRKAKAAGIRKENILIDPGIGFAKQPGDNLKLIRNLKAFKSLGYPVVVGPSRKSFIGFLLGNRVEDRLFGTAAAVALSVVHGADVIRVHDVAAMRQVAAVSSAIAEVC